MERQNIITMGRRLLLSMHRRNSRLHRWVRGKLRQRTTWVGRARHAVAGLHMVRHARFVAYALWAKSTVLAWRSGVCYVDDCTVFSPNFEQHLAHRPRHLHHFGTQTRRSNTLAEADRT